MPGEAALIYLGVLKTWSELSRSALITWFGAIEQLSRIECPRLLARSSGSSVNIHIQLHHRSAEPTPEPLKETSLKLSIKENISTRSLAFGSTNCWRCSTVEDQNLKLQFRRYSQLNLVIKIKIGKWKMNADGDRSRKAPNWIKLIRSTFLFCCEHLNQRVRSLVFLEFKSDSDSLSVKPNRFEKNSSRYEKIFFFQGLSDFRCADVESLLGDPNDICSLLHFFLSFRTEGRIDDQWSLITIDVSSISVPPRAVVQSNYRWATHRVDILPPLLPWEMLATKMNGNVVAGMAILADISSIVKKWIFIIVNGIKFKTH